jgi:GNAT superfamily N-acetyltransferase
MYTIYDKLVSPFIPVWIRRLFASRATVEYLRRSGLMNAGDSIGLDDAIPADIAARGYWTLMVLGVSEEFARRGVGSRLLQWGCDQADRTDRAVLVVASPEGEQLYGRRGFVKVGFNVMLEKKEAEGMTQTYMIRFPASQREKNR